jgi:peptidoglycan hydrolase-like protein with peptidoglycan-binding domain
VKEKYMRLPRTAVAALFVVATSGLVPLAAASPAAAAPQCVLSLYYQNNYVAGNDDLSPNCQMGVGAYGNHVYRNFGPLTRDALKRVQRRLGIDDDGVYGPITARAMNHRRANGASGCDRITF